MADDVTEFETLTLRLISQAAVYSAASHSDPETEAAIRKVRTLSEGLLASLRAIPLRAAPVGAP